MLTTVPFTSMPGLDTRIGEIRHHGVIADSDVVAYLAQ
jgi:hypothetical protein